MGKTKAAEFIRSAKELDQRVYYAIIVVFILALPLALQQNTYYLRIGVLVLLYFMMTLGYNAIVTTAGLFDLGYTAYFAIGAYVSALLLLHTNLSFWIILPISILATVIYTAIVSVPILRFKGDYLCIITLAFAEILRLVLNNWLDVTRGPLGLPGIRDPQLFSFTFSSLTSYYYLAFVLAVVAFIIINRLTYSGIGLRWSAVRENPDAAASVGINVHRAKVLAYLVGTGLAGAAGAVFAPFQGIVSPSVAHLDNTTLMLTMVILGGGHNIGILTSSTVLTIVPELLRSLSSYRLLALGVFFVVIMNVRPEGFRFGVLRHFVLPGWGKKVEQDDKRDSEQEYEEEPRMSPEKVSQLVFRAMPGPQKSETADVLLRGGGVTKDFGGLRAVDAVDFELYRGELLGVIGPNGAGKTTLFNMITGTYPPSAGKIHLGDTEITNWQPHQIARRGVARTFQIIKLLPNLTVLDNVMLACLPKSSTRNGSDLPRDEVSSRTPKEDITLVCAAISYVGLDGREAILAKNLPFGDRRRLELARALATQPYILLMDEPASGMNPHEVDELMDLIRRVRDRGISILLIEHNMKVAMELSDRMIVIDHGAKIAEGTSYEIQRNEQVIEAYLGGGYEVVTG